eukprot:11418940-Karenia_brevis.AAC.1
MRLAGNLAGLKHQVMVGDPTFSKEGRYLGPLPRKCQHKFHKALIGQRNDGQKFLTEKRQVTRQACAG